MQLTEAEALGILNDHQRRVRHIHADLHDRCGDENIVVSRAERAQRRVLFRAFHPSVHQSDAKLRERLVPQRLRPALGGFHGVLLAVLHSRADDIDLMAPAHCFRIKPFRRSRRASLTRNVSTGRLPGGSSAITDTSRSP